MVIDHDRAALLALTHLAELGHERIAFFKGPPSNVDAPFRWRAIQDYAVEIGIEIHPEVVIQTSGLSYGEVFYEEGYSRAQELVKKGLDWLGGGNNIEPVYRNARTGELTPPGVTRRARSIHCAEPTSAADVDAATVTGPFSLLLPGSAAQGSLRSEGAPRRAPSR